ncbi:hypothetical protein AAFF_G00427440 [Aldrovandia affinis]|uniref:Uncharacterized protein n=1 Tax=Aldrovandia affinis TaxID=143900 RepID=A0AAD7WJP1_9TELE|nr:hypothetical protein AAFF_G00427440 [Aldrovandia affinis]
MHSTSKNVQGPFAILYHILAVRVANSYACVGLDQLEKSVPILHQSVEEAMGHLKDALFLALDDLQVNEQLDKITDRMERLLEGTWMTLGVSVGIIRGSFLGATLASGFNNLLTRSK